jgi:ferritin-like metal-binding protein YciE
VKQDSDGSVQKKTFSSRSIDLLNIKSIKMATQSVNLASEAGASRVEDSKLKELFIEQLQDIYWAEKKLVKALGKMLEAATGSELKTAFTEHQQQTREHVERLESVFASIGEDADTTKCPAMAGIISEAEDLIDDTDENTSQRDVALILAAQKAEHYEIASYGGLAQLAKTLGFQEAHQLLAQTLQDEKQADALLTRIAESGTNQRASQEPIDA